MVSLMSSRASIILRRFQKETILAFNIMQKNYID